MHPLPEIFHYWSNKFPLPKISAFGILDPEHLFYAYCQKCIRENSSKIVKIVSLGCGDCDMETKLARKITDDGLENFVIECLDINSAMLSSGKELAADLGVSSKILVKEADFNF